MKSAFNNSRKVYRIAFRFRYLRALNLKVRSVEPEAREGTFSRSRFRLRYLVVVVDGYVLNASRMNIYLLSECCAYHRGAFNVPAGKTFPPRRIPANFFIELPQVEVRRIAFLRICRDARACFLSGKLDGSKFSVSGEAGRIEVDAALCPVRVAFFFERLYHRYLCGNVVARTREQYFRSVDIQRFYILKEFGSVALAEHAHVLEVKFEPFALHAGGHFVLTVVAVGNEVPDVGEIYDLFYFKRVVFKHSTQYIREYEHRKVADVLESIDGRSAVVHPHPGGPRGKRKNFLRSRECVVQI